LYIPSTKDAIAVRLRMALLGRACDIQSTD
jgi:hypothetical protein